MMSILPRLYVIVVLYNMTLENSVSVISLLRSWECLPSDALSVRGLIFDNTPGTEARELDIPSFFRYERPGENRGLAAAYNRALELAEVDQCEWLLTLDHDTQLPETFLMRVADHIKRWNSDESVAAILPHLFIGKRALSPTRFLLGAFGKSYPAGYSGIAENHTYAFNSGSILRVKALQEIGGYDPRFWLDYSDFALFRRLQKRRKRLFVAGDLHLKHGFSMHKRVPDISAFRYRNIVEASSAFYDLEMNRLAALDYNARLGLRYFKHMGGYNGELRKVTLAMLKKRLFRSRSYRIAEWEQENGHREE